MDTFTMILALMVLAIGFAVKNYIVGVAALVVFVFSSHSIVIAILAILLGAILYYVSQFPNSAYYTALAVFIFAILLVLKSEREKTGEEKNTYNPEEDLLKMLGGA